MSRVLAMNTTVDDVTYPAGSTPPEDVAAKITNPKAWDGAADVPVTKLANEQARTEAKRAADETGEPVDGQVPDGYDEAAVDEALVEDFSSQIDVNPFETDGADPDDVATDGDDPEPVPDLSGVMDDPEPEPAAVEEAAPVPDPVADPEPEAKPAPSAKRPTRKK